MCLPSKECAVSELMSGGEVFGAYASFYDSLYADKDYEAECDYVV